jgi:hypothetical protein
MGEVFASGRGLRDAVADYIERLDQDDPERIEIGPWIDRWDNAMGLVTRWLKDKYP